MGPWESKVNAVILGIPGQFSLFSVVRDTEQATDACGINKMVSLPEALEEIDQQLHFFLMYEAEFFVFRVT